MFTKGKSFQVISMMPSGKSYFLRAMIFFFFCRYMCFSEAERTLSDIMGAFPHGE